MTHLLALALIAAGAIPAAIGTHLIDRRRTATADRQHYAAAWSDADRDATLLDLAVERLDKSRWHRTARRLEQEKRNLAEQLAGMWRQPIPLGPGPRHLCPAVYRGFLTRYGAAS